MTLCPLAPSNGRLRQGPEKSVLYILYIEGRAISVDYLLKCTGFQWDEGNVDKNWIKHKVSRTEAEQMFFNRPLVVRANEQRSEHGLRYYALGQTDAGRQLFIVFTIREDLIRVISARPMSRRERRVYEHAKEAATEADPKV